MYDLLTVRFDWIQNRFYARKMSAIEQNNPTDLETMNEPAGASVESMLITTDSIEEMTQELSASLEDDVSLANRLKSKAVIQEIQENIISSADGTTDASTSATVDMKSNLEIGDNGDDGTVPGTSSVGGVNDTLMEKSVAVSETDSGSDQEAFYSGESNGSSGADDYLHNAEWLQQREHIFVISSAGKPIYSLHGNEDKLATLCGVMQALISVVHANQDQLTSIHAYNMKFVFLVKGPLILVAASRRNLSVQQILLQLT